MPAGAILFNWNLGSLDVSLSWFEGRGFQQIVAGTLFLNLFSPLFSLLSVCAALLPDTLIGFYDSGDGFGSGQSEATTANAHTSKNYVKFISNPSSFLFLCLRLTFSSYFLSVSCLLQMFWGICTPPGTMITRK